MSDRRTKIRMNVLNLLDEEPIFLDTETTGLDAKAEIVEIAIIDMAGNVVLNTLVRPVGEIGARAAEVHGITPEILTDAPTFNQILPQLYSLLEGRTVIIYNREFDWRLMEQSAAAWGFTFRPSVKRVLCAMEEYADFYGEWNEYHGNYKWQSLEKAIQQCGITVPDEDRHRALGDARATLAVCKYMAGLL